MNQFGAAKRAAIVFPESLADNCYVDVQVVRGFRGKRVVLRLEECD
jgi:hypothetical protein